MRSIENGNNRTAHFQLLKNEIKVSKGIIAVCTIQYNVLSATKLCPRITLSWHLSR